MKKQNKKPAPGIAAGLNTPELLAQMLNAVASPVFAKDRKHRWIYLNDAFCEFMGHKRTELLGRSDPDFFPEEQVKIFWERDNKVFSGRGEDIGEEFFTDSAGLKHTIITRKQVFREPGGNDVLVGVINDITNLRKANNDLTLFRKLLEHSNDAIFILDPTDGSFLDVNETACRRLGYPRATLLRMGIRDIQATASTAADWRKLRERFISEGPLLVEGRHLRADGTSFPVEVSVSRAESGGKTYILTNARDITERRKMEEAIKEVDTLRGLIPICSKCKKIRNDKGFWEKVETYLEKHSSARFTHGLCKDCMQELYGKETWFKNGNQPSS